MREFVVALTTVPAGHDAAEMARTLVQRGLAACVNLVPGVTSIYQWDGAIETSQEQQLVIKTCMDRVPELDRAIAELSPYDVPECIVIPIVAGSPGYLAWLDQATGR
jgi:periplasmic divalent cation tolerance protein